MPHTAGKPVTKTAARRTVRDVRAYLSVVMHAIDTNNAELLEEYLNVATGVINQLYTDIFDFEIGTGLRGVVED